MNVRDVLAALQAEAKSGSEKLDNAVTGAYCSDLLSDVMANAKKGDLWITLQTHQNIVAVASLAELAGIVITRGAQPDPDTIAKAEKENIPVLTSPLPSFEAAGKLYCLLGLDKK
ncbi:MAG: DRTGG domain-containing protein [Bacillota bacterium]